MTIEYKVPSNSLFIKTPKLLDDFGDGGTVLVEAIPSVSENDFYDVKVVVSCDDYKEEIVLDRFASMVLAKSLIQINILQENVRDELYRQH